MNSWFVHPWLLALAASIVLLWLLPRWTRRTPKVVSWGAARWLEAAIAKQQATRHWRRWIFLVRALLLSSIAFCAAIPRINMAMLSDNSESPRQRTWWIVVVDDGPASSYLPPQNQTTSTPAQSRFETAIEQIKVLISGTSLNDAFSLVGTTSATHRQLQGPSMDRQLIDTRLSGWKPVGLTSNGERTIQHIERLIEEARLSGELFDSIQVVVWSGRGSSAWSDEQSQDLGESLERLSQSCTLSWRDWGQTHDSNIAIESIEGLDGSLIAGITHRMSIRVSNRDQQNEIRTTINVREEGELVASLDVSLAPLESSEIPIEFVPQAQGNRKFVVSTSSDPIALDSTAWRVARVIPQIDLIIITSDPLERRSWMSLASAMRRFGINVVDSTSSGLGQEIWSPATSVVVVGQMPSWSSERATQIKRFVESGGSVWIACGPEQSPALWLEAFDRSDAPWSPTDKTLAPLSIASEAQQGLRLLEDRAGESLASTPVWRQWQRESPLSANWQVEMLRGDLPLFVSLELGRGRVALWLSAWGAVAPETLATADQSPSVWSAFSVWPSFPAIAQQWIVTQVGLDNHRFISLDELHGLNESASQEALRWMWIEQSSAEGIDADPVSSSEVFWPGVLTEDSSSEDSRVIAVGLSPEATQWKREIAGIQWSESSSELPHHTVVQQRSSESDIATTLALGLLAIVLLESWIYRAIKRAPLPSKAVASAVLMGLMLIPLQGLMAQETSDAPPSSSPLTSLPLDQASASDPAANSDGLAERVIWLRSWSFEIWQIVLLGAAIWIASLWLGRINLRSLTGKVAAIIRGLIIAWLLFAAQGWQERRLVEQPTRVAVLTDLSSSMAQIASAESTNQPVASTDPLNANEQDRVPGQLELSEDSRMHEAFRAVEEALGNEIANWPSRFGNERVVDWYSIGEKLARHDSWTSLYAETRSPQQSESRLPECLLQLLEKNAGRSLSGVILITDGVATDSRDFDALMKSVRESRVPWYPVLLGDPTPERTITIESRGLPSSVFVGETLIVQVDIGLVGSESSDLRIELVDLETNEVVSSELWKPEGLDPQQSFELPMSVKRSGANRIAVRVIQANGESQLGVGKTERFQAIEHQSKILLVAGEPSLEFRFLKHAIERARQPGSQENQSFALKSWLQSADLEYAATDSTAIRGFPVDDSELADFDIVILLDPILVTVDRARGLTSADLQRIKRHVEADAASLILIAGPKFDPQTLAGTALESVLPSPLNEFVKWQEGTGVEAGQLKLVATPLGSQLASLRELNQNRLSTNVPDGNAASLAQSPLTFETSSVWFARQLRPGVRPLLVAQPTEQILASDVALTQQSAGRGLVVYQGFVDAYRLRYRSRDARADGYWIQTLHQLARHRWMDQHPQTTISANQDLYRAGDVAELSITRTLDDGGETPTAWVVAPDSQPIHLELEPVGAQLGWFRATIGSLRRGTYLVSIDGTDKVEATSFAFDVIAARQESDPQSPDHQWLNELAELSGGNTITPEDLSSPEDWLPSGSRAIISVGPDRPIWNNSWLVLVWSLGLIGLLFLDWRLRDTARGS